MPDLIPLAIGQVKLIKDAVTLHNLTLKLLTAKTYEEARSILTSAPNRAEVSEK